MEQEVRVFFFSCEIKRYTVHTYVHVWYLIIIVVTIYVSMQAPVVTIQGRRFFEGIVNRFS